MFRLLTAAAVVNTASALRKQRQNKSSASADVDDGASAESSAPMVDGLFTFGAPGVASPGIKNPRSSDGCFPGIRSWSWWQAGFPSYGSAIDTVVPIAGLVGFRHNWMEGAELDISKKRVRYNDCNERLTREPRGSTQAWLHDGDIYVDAVRPINNDAVLNMTILSTKFSYDQNPQQEVAAGVREFGWRLVGTGFEDGSGGVVGGSQVSHLFQQPQSLECLVTFQGSSSLGDWFANLDASKTSFCGLSSRVHRGFRDHMRRMVRASSWQREVRPNLGRCSKVYVAGHSLGGAMASLFTACAASAPSSGDGFSEDYSFIGWQKQSPARLAYK